MVGLTTIKALVSVVRDARWSELRDVMLAQAALLQAQVVLMTQPRGTFGVAPNSAGTLPASEDQRLRAERLARAVVRAARHGVFRPRCLARAIALSRLLSAHGIEGHAIRIGVARTDGKFVAHAWIERGTTVLGDSAAHAATFAPLTNVRIRNDFFA